MCAKDEILVLSTYGKDVLQVLKSTQIETPIKEDVSCPKCGEGLPLDFTIVNAHFIARHLQDWEMVFFAL